MFLYWSQLQDLARGSLELDIGEPIHPDLIILKLGPRRRFSKVASLFAIALHQAQAKNEPTLPKHRSTPAHGPHQSSSHRQGAHIFPDPTRLL
nr:unnamed protein product [Digitaria exilis]